MVSGKPYISTNSATMKAVNAPKLRQSRALAGLKKLKANMTKIATLTTTRGHRPYDDPVCSMASAPAGVLSSALASGSGATTVAAMTTMALVHEDMDQRAGQQEGIGPPLRQVDRKSTRLNSSHHS